MSEVESLHIKLHDTYMNIYKIYYDMSEMSFLSKLLGKKKKVSPDGEKLARNYFQQLEEISKVLIEEINRLERRILAIQESELEKLA